jgi:hypothetical protein
MEYPQHLRSLHQTNVRRIAASAIDSFWVPFMQVVAVTHSNKLDEAAAKVKSNETELRLPMFSAPGNHGRPLVLLLDARLILACTRSRPFLGADNKIDNSGTN